MKKSILALILILALALPCAALAERDDWVTFFLMCNEGMHNDGDDVGNTLMVISMQPEEGRIKQLMFTWDTFIEYEGYAELQLLDQPFRVNGPEETMKVFNANFDTGLTNFMSVNYLNLAAMIDQYGGVTVDVTRAERNAINGIISNKTKTIDSISGYEEVGSVLGDLLSNNYYLEDYGAETHLNGLQAVGFGWLQYDSVYNCCLREVDVIADLFYRVGETIDSLVLFYDDPAALEGIGDDGRRRVDVNNMSEEDIEYINELISPIFDMSYNNLSRQDIADIALAITRSAFEAKKQGVNMFERIELEVLPLEKLEPYENVAGIEGHVIDREANAKAIREFLFEEA